MVHQLFGHEFEQAPGDGEGQGSLACCSPWRLKESYTTEQLNNNTKRGEAGTEADMCTGRMPHDDGGRDLSDAAEAKECEKCLPNYLELGERH